MAQACRPASLAARRPGSRSAGPPGRAGFRLGDWRDFDARPCRKLFRPWGLRSFPPQSLRQRDTFFACSHGRLKLRDLGTGEAELIFSAPPDVPGTKQSDYVITPVPDPGSLKAILSEALGVTQVVEKTRVLSLVGQTRVHLDSVDGLGEFLELEVVLCPGQTAADGQAIATALIRRLEIREVDLCSGAYADMLGGAASRPAAPGPGSL